MNAVYPMFKFVLTYFLSIISVIPILGNGLEVTNVRVVNRDTVANTIYILADISWQNSWRLDSTTAPGNYDAAWVFVKVRTTDTSSHHLILAEGSITTPDGADIEIAPDGTGFFIFHSSLHQGPANFSNLTIQWNYGLLGIPDTAEIVVKVFAIEMVYIPEAAFIAGTAAGGLEQTPFIPTTINTGLSTLVPDGTDGIDGTPTGGHPQGQIPPDFNNFPNGYNATYCMKYELTQDQYAAFLNDLPPTQATKNFQPLETLTKLPYRYNIYIDSITNTFVSGNPFLPINVLGYTDGAAYADWSGLRLMTELEFEKICRGPESSIPGTYPWGDTTCTTVTYSLLNAGTENELMATMDYMNGSAYYLATNGSIEGPVRSGIFAATSIIPTRKATGATYYGVMDMGGNVLERTVVMFLPEGRAYKGTHGDGYLSAAGLHTNLDWPSALGYPFGISGRGGKWNTEAAKMLISDRSLVLNALNSRYHNAGFRFVRTSYE